MEFFRRFFKGTGEAPQPPRPEQPLPQKKPAPDIDVRGQIDQNWAIAQPLLPSRTIVLKGEIIPDLTDRLIGHVLLLERLSPAPIMLVIRSAGGQAYAGLAVYDVLSQLTVPLITVVEDVCAGNALLLLLAGHKRYALKDSSIASTVLSGGAMGQPSDLVIQNNQIRRLQAMHDAILQERTEKPSDSAAPLWDLTTTREFSPDEAIYYHLIDAVVERIEDIDLGAV